MSVFTDRTRESSTTTGTGTITTAAVAPAGYQTFAAAGLNGLTVDYCIEAVDANGVPTGDWEVGRGVYTTAGSTLTRPTILGSSNAGAAVNFAAGTKNVFVTAAAASLANLTKENTFAQGTITTSKPQTFTQTWNDGAVTFTGKLNNYTATASAAASLMEDWQVGSVSMFNLRKDGLVTSTKNGSHGFSVTVSGQNPVAFGRSSSVGGFNIFGGSQATPSDSNADMFISGVVVRMTSTSVLGFSSSNITQNTDAGRSRKAAGVSEENNGTKGSYTGTAYGSGSQTVAQLPTAANAGAGGRSFVTDATATTFMSTVAGGGANAVPVVSDGTNWKIG